jgi:hypothetical protein
MGAAANILTTRQYIWLCIIVIVPTAIYQTIGDNNRNNSFDENGMFGSCAVSEFSGNIMLTPLKALNTSCNRL